MKIILWVALATIWVFTAHAQIKVPANEAFKYVGQKITVCGKVFGSKFLDKAKGQPTFLNVGAAYPNAPFTVVIFGETRKAFSDSPEKLYNGKNICVTGVVQEYKGKVEIVVSKADEIVVEKN